MSKQSFVELLDQELDKGIQFLILEKIDSFCPGFSENWKGNGECIEHINDLTYVVRHKLAKRIIKRAISGEYRFIVLDTVHDVLRAYHC